MHTIKDACKMPAAPLVSFSCSRPFTSFRPTIQRRPVANVTLYRIQHRNLACRSHRFCKRTVQHGWLSQRSVGTRPSFQINATTDPLVPLGLDFLTFLAATVLVIPLFKSVKASPVLGFLFSGLLLGQLGYVAVPLTVQLIVSSAVTTCCVGCPRITVHIDTAGCSATLKISRSSVS